MLVLTRRCGEGIVIDGRITVTIVQVSGGRIRLAIEAPAAVDIERGELADGRRTDVFLDCANDARS